MPIARRLTLIVIAATSFRAFATEPQPPAPANPPSDTAKQADDARVYTKEDIAAIGRSSQDEIADGQRRSSAGGSLGH